MITLKYKSKYKTEMIDITKDIEEAVIKSGINGEAVNIFVPHSSCSVFMCEHIDPKLTRDVLTKLQQLIPSNDNYLHDGENAEAHIKASLMGASTTIPINDVKLQMGEWQGIFLAEFDGPRDRDIYITILN